MQLSGQIRWQSRNSLASQQIRCKSNEPWEIQQPRRGIFLSRSSSLLKAPLPSLLPFASGICLLSSPKKNAPSTNRSFSSLNQWPKSQTPLYKPLQSPFQNKMMEVPWPMASKPIFLPLLTKRSLFDFIRWPGSIRKLESNADAKPEDAQLQAALLRALNGSKRFREVQKRFETGKYAFNEDCKKEYLKSLVNLNQLDQIELQTFFAATSTAESGSSSQTGRPGLQWHPTTLSVEVVKTPRNLGLQVIIWTVGIVSGIILCLLFFAIFGRGSTEEKSGPLNSFPVSNAHSLMKNNKTKFEDVKGIDEAKQELIEVVEYLKNPQKFTKLGAKLPKGVLLMGSPGTGKTLMARAVAGEAGVPFLYCSGSAFDELFVGVGPRRIRNLFADAKKLAPCIVFIDEIDAIGTSRKFSISGSYSRESTLNQLLTELDGFQQTEGIIIIGATNFPDVLDTALTRPGRFDKQIFIPAPDIKGRKEILDMYLSQTVTGPDVDSRVIARGTPGFTGADLFNLINLAAIKATVQDKPAVDMRVLEEAKDDILMGIQRKGVEQTEENRKLTAYHEGGHALVALYTEGSTPLHKATIIQRGDALGMTVQLPEADVVSVSKKQMMATLAVCMGGTAAEEVIFGSDQVTSGASSDLKKATKLAYDMVAHWGMSESIGKVYANKDTMSDDQRKLIDAEVKKLLSDSFNYASSLLKAREEELHRVAKALLDNETLNGEEIRLAAEGSPIPQAI